MKKLIIGCDHAAVELKGIVRDHLIARGFDVEDVGVHTTDSCNYPDIARKVCEKVQCGEREIGILVCGTGIGMSMCANKVKGIRAAAVSDCFTAEATRRHNDANVLCLGERTVGPGLALRIIDTFVAAPFDGGRHQTRIDMMMSLEEK